MTDKQRAQWVKDRMPRGGLFLGQEWRVSPEPFALDAELADNMESLGRVLLQFYRALNLLYRHSIEGRQPAWVAAYLDQGKPPEIISLQRAAAFKNEVPRVIRPDILVTEDGCCITELDSVPGGIGLTAWLNETYSQVTQEAAPDNQDGIGGARRKRDPAVFNPGAAVIGGADGMLRGFAGMFPAEAPVDIVVSEEAAVYRPEMEWLAQHIDPSRFRVRDAKWLDFAPGSGVYRFFELFDLANVPNAGRIFELASAGHVKLTPAPKAFFEEKLMFALLWNGHLREFWRRNLGEAFFARMRRIVPQTWVVDPAPLPPHGAIPGLDLTDWGQLKALSQRDRELILKVSGYSPQAWGARGVHLGNDMSQADWSAAVDEALASFEQSPYILQRYHKPVQVAARYLDESSGELISMPARARLCPYYFVHGDNEAARATLGGVLATLCPADKKIIHGMRDAIMAPCGRAAAEGRARLGVSAP